MPNVTEKAMREATFRHQSEKRQVYLIAIQLIDRVRKSHEEYDADVDRWYRHRHINEGHSYPTCIHGVSRWVDYDCACGPCENGEGYFDYLNVARWALGEAKERWDNYWEAQRAYIWMVSHRYDLEKAGEFSQWAHNKYLVVR